MVSGVGSFIPAQKMSCIIVTTKKTSAIMYAFEGIINFSTEQKFRNKMLEERAETWMQHKD